MASFDFTAELAPSDGAYHGSPDADGLSIAGTYGMYYRSGRTARNGLYGYGIANSTQTGYDTYSWALGSNGCAQAPSTTNSLRSRMYFRYDVRPTAAVQIIAGTNNQYNVWLGWKVLLNANGTISVMNGGGTIVFTSTFVTNVNTWYRLEWNYAPANVATGATSKVMLACGAEMATFVATNSTTQAYYYSTAFQMAASTNTVIPGIGTHIFGKCDQVSWKSDVEFDDIHIDNNSFTNTVSTWIGKALSVYSAVVPMAATAGFSTAGSRATSDGLIARAWSTLDFTGDMPKVGGVTAGALSSLAIAVQRSMSASLIQSAVAALAVTPGGLSRSIALAIAASSTLTDGGVRTTTGSLVTGASSSALYGAVRSQNSVVGVDARGALLLDVTGLWQAPWIVSSSGLLTVNVQHSSPFAWTTAALAGMTLTGRKDMSAVLPVRGSPALSISPSLSHVPTFAPRGVGGLTVAGTKNLLTLVPLSALGRLAILALVVAQRITPDEVLAWVIGQPAVQAVIKSPGAIAELVEMGRTATVLDPGLREAIVLPSGVFAVVQE